MLNIPELNFNKLNDPNNYSDAFMKEKFKAKPV